MAQPHRIARLGLVLALAAGAVLAGQGTYMKAKAALSQVLLARSFDARVAGDQDARPWPWADFTVAARIEAPRLGKSAIVIAGASGEGLAFGPAHMTATPMPGEEGTSVIAAHRDSHFAWLKEVKTGDMIRVTNPDGKTLDFTVKTTRVARWNQNGINVAALGHHLDLVTCWPFDALVRGDLRYIVETELVSPKAVAEAPQFTHPL